MRGDRGGLSAKSRRARTTKPKRLPAFTHQHPDHSAFEIQRARCGTANRINVFVRRTLKCPDAGPLAPPAAEWAGIDQPHRHPLTSLRGPGGCPWEHEQAHAQPAGWTDRRGLRESGRSDRTGDDANLREELGDLLLQSMYSTRRSPPKKDASISMIVARGHLGKARSPPPARVQRRAVRRFRGSPAQMGRHQARGKRGSERRAHPR